MIKIAFCDDDLSVLRELGALMDKYRVERNQDIMYASFNSPLELLTEVERGTRLDIIFLDVLMPAQNGISTAREIRQYDTSVTAALEVVDVLQKRGFQFVTVEEILFD